jgi:hypothetical protein
MKIRVLHVIDHLGYGGAPFVVKGIVERMPADRVESLICALRPNPKPLPVQAEVITLKSQVQSGCHQVHRQICKTHRIDIVTPICRRRSLAVCSLRIWVWAA